MNQLNTALNSDSKEDHGISEISMSMIPKGEGLDSNSNDMLFSIDLHEENELMTSMDKIETEEKET